MLPAGWNPQSQQASGRWPSPETVSSKCKGVKSRAKFLQLDIIIIIIIILNFGTPLTIEHTAHLVTRPAHGKCSSCTACVKTNWQRCWRSTHVLRKNVALISHQKLFLIMRRQRERERERDIFCEQCSHTAIIRLCSPMTMTNSVRHK